MKKKNNFLTASISVLFVLLLLSGCMNESSKIAPSTSPSSEEKVDRSTEVNESDQPASSEEVNFLTGDKFKQNSDFIVTAFELSYDKSKNAILYHMNYKLGPDAVAFILSGKHSYYFRLEVPEKWQQSFESNESEEVKGPQLINDSANIYSVTMSIPLDSNVKSETIQQILKDPSNYVLYLYENPAFPARTVGNVYGWMKNNY